MESDDKIVFPYETLAQAEKDRFKRIGGADAAFRFLVKGFKSVAWRKRADLNAKHATESEDAKFAAENARPALPAPPPSKRSPRKTGRP